MMNEFDNKENTQKNEVFSQAVRTRKRTYFFDLKMTKSEAPYLTITESKRRFDQNTGNFYYEKRKIFLLKEDLSQFHNELGKVIETIENHPQWWSENAKKDEE